MEHTSFVTLTRGLRRDSLPMRLYEKAKRYGIWNPSDIDFSKDI
jgi:ribonucleoside-diphosphate reductase beta chain